MPSIFNLLLLTAVSGKKCTPKKPANDGIITIETPGQQGKVVEDEEIVPPVIPAPFLVFEPANLSIRDSDNSKQFTVKLGSKPAGDTKIKVEAKGITIDNCELQFSEENYDTPVTIRVTTNPQFPNNKIEFVEKRELDIYFDEKTGEKRNELYKVERTVIEGQKCQSYGDPHFRTFEGYLIHNQREGVVSLFKDEHLEVQTLQTACQNWKGATCNTGVAIRYGKTIFAWEMGQGLNEFRQVTENTDHVQYIPPTDKNVSHTIKLPDGSKLIATLVKTSDFINVNLFISAEHGGNAACGMCKASSLGYEGNGPEVNDMTDEQKTVLQAFFDANMVSDEEINSMFHGALPQSDAPEPVLQCGNDNITYTKLNDFVPLSCEASTTKRELQEDFVPPTHEDLRKAAEEKCGLIGSDNEQCAEVVDLESLFLSCVEDVVISGEFNFVSFYQDQFQSECEAEIEFMMDSDDHDIVVEGGQVSVAAGFGDNACIANCSGHGSCMETGCLCGEGWFGSDCSLEVE